MVKKNNTLMYGAISLAVLIVAVIGIGFYGGNAETSEMEDVTLMFGFTPNVGYAPFYVAAANGYYNEEGLDVSFQYSADGGADATKQVVSGNVDFGYAGDNEVIIGRLQDIPIMAVQRIVQKNLFGIYSKEDLNITKPDDLVGKKVTFAGPAAPTVTTTKIMFEQLGINFNQINPLYVGGAAISTHLSGEADAFAGYLPQKVVAGVIGKTKMNEISMSDYTTLGRTYLFTSDKMVKERPEVVRKFVRATQKGLEYSIAHPEEATDAYIKYNPEAAEKKVLHLAIWKAMVERGFDKDANGKPILHLPSEDKWAEKQDQMFAVGAIDKKTDVSKMYTDEFVPK